MKIFTFIKFLSLACIGGGGIAAAVSFSNFNTIRFPTVRILTKENYNKIKQQQGITNSQIQKGVDIDYYSLPSTGYTTYDIANGIKQNYMFFFGSEAYADTTRSLYGWNNGFAQSQASPIQYSNSLMLNLYDLFLTDNQKAIDYGVDKVNPIFLNYVDICSTKDITDSEYLFYDRFYNMGDRNYDGLSEKKPGYSREWIVNASDVLNTRYEPVVKGATSYNYNPEASTYDFRPNNGVDTKYEQVYFRDQNVVKSFNDISSFFNNYLNNQHGIPFSKTGTLLCVKYENNSWSFKSITSFSQDVEKQIVDIVKFYNPNYVDNSKDESTDSSGQSGETQTPPSTDQTQQPSQPTTRANSLNIFVKRDIPSNNLYIYAPIERKK